MSVGPAYKSFIAGECSEQVAQQYLQEGSPFRKALEKCMYGSIDFSDYFYHVGYQRFLHQFRTLMRSTQTPISNAGEMEGVIKYYYNRQLIVQMTMQPQSNKNDSKNPFYVSVPLYKAPHYELQTDILQLLPEQSKTNFNLKYMVVIVDTFSRFIWACPVSTLESKKVQKAFISALMRPGIAVENYEFLRQRIQRVVVDGGSEFKSVFPKAINLYFPNAKVITSSAKNRTGNRPTGNGPIEAAIRILRLVIIPLEFHETF